MKNLVKLVDILKLYVAYQSRCTATEQTKRDLDQLKYTLSKSKRKDSLLYLSREIL